MAIPSHGGGQQPYRRDCDRHARPASPHVVPPDVHCVVDARRSLHTERVLRRRLPARKRAARCLHRCGRMAARVWRQRDRGAAIQPFVQGAGRSGRTRERGFSMNRVPVLLLAGVCVTSLAHAQQRESPAPNATEVTAATGATAATAVATPPAAEPTPANAAPAATATSAPTTPATAAPA